MTPSLARQRTWPLAAKPNKYGAIKVTLDGHRFDSKREAAVYAELKLREKIGEIARLTVHPKWRLSHDGELITNYTPDFSFIEVVDGRHDRLVVVDVKSPATAKRRDFVLVRKLMKAIHKIEVEVWH